MGLELSPEFLLVGDRDALGDAVDDEEEEAEAERVESQVLGCDVFGLYPPEFHRSSEDDQLVAGSIVSPHQFGDPRPYLSKGVQLSELQVILQHLEQQQERLSDLVGPALDDDLAADDAEVAHLASLLLQQGVGGESIDEDAGLEVDARVGPQVAAVACIGLALRLRFSDSPVIR